MKNLVWLLAVGFAGSVLAQDTKAPASPAATKAPAKTTVKASTAKPAAKTHEVDAEIVATDATAKTITIKADPDNKTVPVEGKALAALKNHKAGDKVTLVCRDNDKGEHQAIVDIKAPKPAAAAPATNK
jgi:glucose/arabinose dehydrogenase